MPFGSMKPTAMIDSEFGALRWNPDLEWWEGSVKLASAKPFTLYIFARETADGRVSDEARRTFRTLAQFETECRRYAAAELLEIHNQEWAEGKEISESEFIERLIPDSVEIHESGYMEFHFHDDDLFWGHGVGVRIQPDGKFQEAVVEG
jgi:hypothetical protein